MVKATDSYHGLLMSPKFVIDRMRRVVEKHGTRKAESSGRFKREREAWTSAVWALGLAEVTDREYWVEVETVDQTPDTKVHYIDQSAGHNHLMTYNVEVVDWVEQVQDPMQVIRQKCARAYPSYYVLLVLGRSGREVQPDKLVELVQGLTVPFWEIWILGRLADSTVNMARLHPSPTWINFDVMRSLQKKANRTDVLVRQKRGKSTEFEKLGSVYLPIP
jgi:hypothetical protein